MRHSASRVYHAIRGRVEGTAAGWWLQTTLWRSRAVHDGGHEPLGSRMAHPRRARLVELVGSFAPTSVLEVGCSDGPNVILLANAMPLTRVVGIDVHEGAARAGEAALAARGIKNARIHEGDLRRLHEVEGAFDVIVSDATLMYVPRHKIVGTLRTLIDRARSGLVLSEWHEAGAGSRYHYGHWVHDLEALLIRASPRVRRIEIEPAPMGPTTDRSWAQFGTLARVELAAR